MVGEALTIRPVDPVLPPAARDTLLETPNGGNSHPWRRTCLTDYRDDDSAPNGCHTHKLKTTRGIMRSLVVTAVCAILMQAESQVGAHQTELLRLRLPNELTMQFVKVPPGTFDIGSPVSEEGGKSDEKPVHLVNITSGFFMGDCEVTEEQYEAVTSQKPPVPRGRGRPAFGVSWTQSAHFCHQLSQIFGRPCRLPTEAEWEYACRAGSTSRYWCGDSRAALLANKWCGNRDGGSSNDEPKEVGTRVPNPWGLRDMHGNAVEWGSDWYGPYTAASASNPCGPVSGDNRVARGGSFIRYPNDCRSATRSQFDPDYSGGSIGFRVVIASEVPSASVPESNSGSAQGTGGHGHCHYRTQRGFVVLARQGVWHSLGAVSCPWRRVQRSFRDMGHGSPENDI